MAGQPVDSNAVDGGSVTAQDASLADRTTRTDGVPDKGQVDMGYHYEQGAPQYCLSVTIVPDQAGKTHGGVTPSNGSYMAGTAVVLNANADPGYALAGWYDANDTLLSVRSQYNLVMDSNEVLHVRFRVPQKIAVSGGGKAIQQAVNQADNGDTLVIAPGVYSGGIDLAGKAIRLVSTNPDDPTITAQTIIDCGGRSRALIFNHGEGPDTVISGLTIRNGGTVQEGGGAIYIGRGCGPTFVNLSISNCTVQLFSGGAIYMDLDSYPTFCNVKIDNCRATGQTVTTTTTPPVTTIVGGGNGGAVYIHVQSRPTFTDCAFTNCSALGLGGAVYCGPAGLARFTNCLFQHNDANEQGGAVYHTPEAASVFQGCQFLQNTTDYLGGALYYGRQCTVDVNDCQFSQSVADVSGGALYFDGACTGRVVHSVLVHNDANEAGGAFYANGCKLDVADCNVAYNRARLGGGLYWHESPDSTIERCLIKHNEAVGLRVYLFQPNATDPNLLPKPILPGDPAYSLTSAALTHRKMRDPGAGGPGRRYLLLRRPEVHRGLPDRLQHGGDLRRRRLPGGGRIRAEARYATASWPAMKPGATAPASPTIGRAACWSPTARFPTISCATCTPSAAASIPPMRVRPSSGTLLSGATGARWARKSRWPAAMRICRSRRTSRRRIRMSI